MHALTLVVRVVSSLSSRPFALLLFVVLVEHRVARARAGSGVFVAVGAVGVEAHDAVAAHRATAMTGRTIPQMGRTSCVRASCVKWECAVAGRAGA